METGALEREVRQPGRERVGLRTALELGIEVGTITAELLAITLVGMMLELGTTAELLATTVGMGTMLELGMAEALLGEAVGVVITALVLPLALEAAAEDCIEIELVMVVHTVVSP